MSMLRGAWALTWRFTAIWLAVRVILAFDELSPRSQPEAGAIWVCAVCGVTVGEPEVARHELWHEGMLLRTTPPKRARRTAEHP